MRYSAVLVAAGRGERMGSDLPKQWRQIGGRPVARWALEGLLAGGCTEVVVVIGQDHEPLARAAFAGLSGWRLALGGATRSVSVKNGLAALNPDVEAILVHDAARPFVRSSHIAALIAALGEADGALPALPVPDTLKRADATGRATGAVARDGLFRAQTPQAFRTKALLDAYAEPSAEATDDAALVEARGGVVRLVPGDPLLNKLTYPEDFDLAEVMIAPHRRVRVGQGFDAHRFGPGEAVWLCGVKLDHDQSLIGHSDADVGLHALTDAVLGALSLGDIGDHFPPTDPQWKGAPSDLFLRHAARLARQSGAVITQVDVTLICEAPKIKPHRQAMRARLAEILGMDIDGVSVKATTTEGMGFTGRREGIAAQALATLEIPTLRIGARNHVQP